jgi:hypothetical protein
MIEYDYFILSRSGEAAICHLKLLSGNWGPLHPDQENYPGQRIYFVIVEAYIYLVPHVVEKDYVFLKTIIPSRKATRAYTKEQGG